MGHQHRLLQWLLIGAVLTVLTACGGNGGSSSSNSHNQDDTSVPTDDTGNGGNDDSSSPDDSDPDDSTPDDTPAPIDPNADDDNDGYINSVEESEGTDPNDPASVPADLDNDFIPDSTDQDKDGDNVANAADIDADGDGLIEIYTVLQLDYMRHDLSGASLDDGNTSSVAGCSNCNGYELMNDLDFDTNGDGVLNASDTFFDPSNDGSNLGWEPIGGIVPFVATFDGNGHTISNLYINRAENNVGLFAHIGNNATGKTAELKNITLSGDLGSITGNRRVGALVGLLDNATLDNTHATRNVTATLSPAGGLVGRAENNSIIKNASAHGQVQGSGDLGGLVGSSETNIVIQNSFATTIVTSTGPYTGGLLGYGRAGITISDCYATGNVTATGQYSVGGLVGVLEATGGESIITNSYATGDVIGASELGGLVGEIQNSAQIDQTYATGDVTATSHNVGGLVGKASAIHISRSYSTGTIYGFNAVGGLVGKAGDNSFITASYTVSDVSGEDVGGLGGQFTATTVSYSYSVGYVNDRAPVGGGLIGTGDNTVTFNNSYWATDTSNHTSAEGNSNTVVFNKTVGFLNSELKCPVAANDSACAASTVFEGWDSIDHDNDSNSDPIAPWSFNSNSELPSL